jgi:hypothetical protein
MHSIALDEYNEVCENNGAIKVMMKRDGRDGVEPVEGVIRNVICKIWNSIRDLTDMYTTCWNCKATKVPPATVERLHMRYI